MALASVSATMYALQMEGKFVVGGDGSVRITEEEGLDFAAVTV